MDGGCRFGHRGTLAVCPEIDALDRTLLGELPLDGGDVWHGAHAQIERLQARVYALQGNHHRVCGAVYRDAGNYILAPAHHRERGCAGDVPFHREGRHRADCTRICHQQVLWQMDCACREGLAARLRDCDRNDCGRSRFAQCINDSLYRRHRVCRGDSPQPARLRLRIRPRQIAEILDTQDKGSLHRNRHAEFRTCHEPCGDCVLGPRHGDRTRRHILRVAQHFGCDTREYLQET